MEVLFPEKTSELIAGERSSAHAGPILPFFFFPGIVLPFFRGQYFHFVTLSVVRKVTEKPVLFLPHPIAPGQSNTMRSPHFPYITNLCGTNVGISASLVNGSAATFQLPNLKHVETCVNVMTDAKHFIMFLKEKCLQSMLGLQYFTLLCNDAEYKNMDQGKRLGQLYDVQN